MKKVLTLLVGYDDGTVASHFGVWFEGALWLVTAWIANTTSGVATPERMIRVEEFQEATPDSGFDYENILLPRWVIEGKTEIAEGYEVRSLPETPVVHRDDLYTLPSIF